MKLSKEIFFVVVSLLLGVALIITVEQVVGAGGQVVMLAKNVSAGATTAAAYLTLKWLDGQPL